MRTLDRPETIFQCLKLNLIRAGMGDYELLVWDNGSTDIRTSEIVKKMNPAYHREYEANLGNAQAFNQLILRAKGEFIIDLGSDIILPPNWLKKWIDTYETIMQAEKIGSLAYHWGYKEWATPVNINGAWVSPTLNPFGSMMFHRDLLKDVGYMCEDYGVYGLWDGDFHVRSSQAGCSHFYMPGDMSQHVGTDVGQQSEYRQMKDRSLKAGTPILAKNRKRYEQGEYYIAPPKEL